MTAALMQLIGVGRVNKCYPLNYTISRYILNSKSNNNIIIARNGDTIIFEALIMPEDINFDHIFSFEIEIGGNVIWKIPFELLLKLIPPKHIKNKYYITFDKNLFGDTNQPEMLITGIFELPLIALPYSEVRIILKSSVKFPYDIITNYVFYDTKIRTKIAEKSSELKITQYHTLDITNYETKLNTNCVWTGLYIKTNSPITKYVLQLHGLTHTELSEELIEYYKNLISKRYAWTKKHSLILEYSLNKFLPKDMINVIEDYATSEIKWEYLYYFPVSQIGSIYDDNSTINSEIIEVVVKIQTEDENYHGQIYVEGKNILRIDRGLGYLKFFAYN